MRWKAVACVFRHGAIAFILPKLLRSHCRWWRGLTMNDMLWLDDVRRPPSDEWTWARSAHEALNYLAGGGIRIASLDHDLGGIPAEQGGVYDDTAPTGTDLVQWMIQSESFPTEQCIIHSINGPGATRMLGMLLNALSRRGLSIHVQWRPESREH